MNERASKGTLFDFNGVLIDDEAVHEAAFREVVAPLGITIDAAVYAERYLGFDDAGAFRAMLADAGRPVSDAIVGDLVEAKRPIYMARIATALRIFDGAAEIVRRRAAIGPCGIVSGALRHEIEHALGVLELTSAIAFIVSAEDTNACKPDPEGYLRGIVALAERGVDRRRVVAIEDSLDGIASARSAGLRCAAVAHSYPAQRLREARAEVVVERLADLTDALLDGT